MYGKGGAGVMGPLASCAAAQEGDGENDDEGGGSTMEIFLGGTLRSR